MSEFLATFTTYVEKTEDTGEPPANLMKALAVNVIRTEFEQHRKPMVKYSLRAELAPENRCPLDEAE